MMKTGSDFFHGLGLALDRAAAREEALQGEHAASSGDLEAAAVSTEWQDQGAADGTIRAETPGVHENPSQTPQTRHGQQPLQDLSRDRSIGGGQGTEHRGRERVDSVNGSAAGNAPRVPQRFADVMAAGLAKQAASAGGSADHRAARLSTAELPMDMAEDSLDAEALDLKPFGGELVGGAAFNAEAFAGAALTSQPLDPVEGTVADRAAMLTDASVDSSMVASFHEGVALSSALSPSRAQNDLPGSSQADDQEGSRLDLASAKIVPQIALQSLSASAVDPSQALPQRQPVQTARATAAPRLATVASPQAEVPIASRGDLASAGKHSPAPAAAAHEPMDRVPANPALHAQPATQLAPAAQPTPQPGLQPIVAPEATAGLAVPNSRWAAQAVPAKSHRGPEFATIHRAVTKSQTVRPDRLSTLAHPGNQQHSAATAAPSPRLGQADAPAAPSLETFLPSTGPIAGSLHLPVAPAPDLINAALERQGQAAVMSVAPAVSSGVAPRAAGQRVTRSELNRRTEARVAEVIRTLTAEKSATAATPSAPGRWRPAAHQAGMPGVAASPARAGITSASTSVVAPPTDSSSRRLAMSASAQDGRPSLPSAGLAAATDHHPGVTEQLATALIATDAPPAEPTAAAAATQVFAPVPGGAASSPFPSPTPEHLFPSMPGAQPRPPQRSQEQPGQRLSPASRRQTTVSPGVTEPPVASSMLPSSRHAGVGTAAVSSRAAAAGTPPKMVAAEVVVGSPLPGAAAPATPATPQESLAQVHLAGRPSKAVTPASPPVTRSSDGKKADSSQDPPGALRPASVNAGGGAPVGVAPPAVRGAGSHANTSPTHGALGTPPPANQPAPAVPATRHSGSHQGASASPAVPSASALPSHQFAATSSLPHGDALPLVAATPIAVMNLPALPLATAETPVTPPESSATLLAAALVQHGHQGAASSSQVPPHRNVTKTPTAPTLAIPAAFPAPATKAPVALSHLAGKPVPPGSAQHSLAPGAAVLAQASVADGQPRGTEAAPVIVVEQLAQPVVDKAPAKNLSVPKSGHRDVDVASSKAGSGAPVAAKVLDHPMAPGSPPTVTPELRVASASALPTAPVVTTTTSPPSLAQSPSALTTPPATIPLVAPAQPLPPRAVESRRVRAAVLELHHRLLPVESSNAGVPSSSRNVFDTASRGDKSAASQNHPFTNVGSPRLANAVAPRFMKAAATPPPGAHAATAELATDDNHKASTTTSPASPAELAPRGRVVTATPFNVALPASGPANSPAALVTAGTRPQLAAGHAAALVTSPPSESSDRASTRVASPETPSSSPASSSSSSSASSGSSASSDRKRDQQSSSSPPAAPELARTGGLAADKAAADNAFSAAAGLSLAPPPGAIDPRAMGSLVQQGPPGTRPLMDLAADDPSLHATALGKNAHVRLETAKDGDLSLHLMVHDGVVDVRFDGAASRTLDIRSNEVRAALAGEGIALGSFESNTRSAAGNGTSSGSTASADGNAAAPSAPGHASGNATSSHTGSHLGGGGGGHRHSDPGDRWPDREPSSSSSTSSSAGAGSAGSTASNKPQAEPRRRRGFHVTA